MTPIAFVYKWTHLPALRWYIGSHTSKTSHPSDGYICSSKEAKYQIKTYPSEWQRTIIATGSPADMRQLEAAILQLFDAKNDVRSFNNSNADGKFTTAGKPRAAKAVEAHKRKLTGRTYSDDHCAAISAALTNKPKSHQHRENLRKAGTGKVHTPEHRAKNSASNKGKPKPATSAALKGRKKPPRTPEHSKRIADAKIEKFRLRVLSWTESELQAWLSVGKYKTGKGFERRQRVKQWRGLL